MARILLIGYPPPVLVRNTKIEAAHYRTWQFLEPLLYDGHKVCLCADNPHPDHDNQQQLPAEWSGQLTYHAIPFRRRFGWTQQLQQIHDKFMPDCIVAVNFDCCLCATKLHTTKPIWMDIYGDPLTIMQVARYRAGSDRGIPTSIAFVRKVLQKGDMYSVCGTPQQHAIVGELAMAGRLNSHTLGYQFAQIILPGSPSMGTKSDKLRERPQLCSKGVSSENFVVLWCGGYNTWTDVETLFSGLEWAMAQNPNIHYVSIGASTYNVLENAYDRFLKMIEASKFSNNFHMLGWQPWNEVINYYRESDVGLSIDALHYETIYGTRTRLVEMIAAGLPVITSLGCELSDLLGRRGAGLTFNTGDWRGLGEQILTVAMDQDLCSRMARTALDYAKNDLSFAVTTDPIRNWVQNPQLAPDKEHVTLGRRFRYLEYNLRSVLRRWIWQITGLDRV